MKRLSFALFFALSSACAGAPALQSTNDASSQARAQTGRVAPMAAAARATATPRADAPAYDRDAIRDVLAARRAKHLDALLAYANAGVFPKNRVGSGPINVFIDDDGHLCAAANLMQLDGHGDLVSSTANDDNLIVLASVTDGPLMDWMLTSGFTQEEIARIQEPYMEVGMSDPDFGRRIAVSDRSAEDIERERIQAVLRGVHQVLVANSDKSLGLALKALDERPAALAALAAATTPEREG